MAPRRRDVLAGAAVVLAGCTSVEELADRVEHATRPDGHPLDRGEPISVRVVDRGRSDHDLGSLTREALTFWESNDAQYVGFPVSFDVVEHVQAGAQGSEKRVDIEVVYVDSRSDLTGCEDYHTEDILGCAPLLTEGSWFERPATAEIVATDRPRGEVLITVKHELGHILGLGHDDDPAYVMSNDIEDRLPEYEHRIEVVEAFEAAWETRNEGTRAYNDGIGHWNEKSYEAAASDFERSERRYRSVHDHVSTAREAATAFDGMNRPDTVDRDRLETYLDRIDEMATHYAAAAAAMADASVAAAEGDMSTAHSRQQNARNLLEEIDDMTFPSPGDAAVALGLVRERDKDEEDEPDQAADDADGS